VAASAAEADQDVLVIVRALAVWLVIVGAEIVHGIARRILLEPRVGDVRARQVGVATGSLLILIITFFSLPWLGAHSTRDRLGVGLLWLTLMVPFEVLVGRLTGTSWRRIGSDYDPRQGGFMALGLSLLLLAPMLVGWAQSR
jgi:hypothetical protein